MAEVVCTPRPKLVAGTSRKHWWAILTYSGAVRRGYSRCAYFNFKLAAESSVVGAENMKRQLLGLISAYRN